MRVKPYFIFSKTERLGILIVFILIICIIVVPRVIFLNTQSLQIKKDSLLTYLNPEGSIPENVRVENTSLEITEKININAATKKQLQQIPCVDDKIASRILSYRKKVKKFDSIQEIKKVYGLTDTCYEQLLSYIVIDSARAEKEKTKPKNTQKINLNTCDSLQLVALKGIGAKTAKRILKIRDKIKVFYGMQQLPCLGLGADITRHLQEQCYVDPQAANTIQVISLNTVEDKAVFKSPGFKYEMAKSFVQYRKMLKKQGKTITTWEEITQNVKEIDKEWLSCWQVYYTL